MPTGRPCRTLYPSHTLLTHRTFQHCFSLSFSPVPPVIPFAPARRTMRRARLAASSFLASLVSLTLAFVENIPLARARAARMARIIFI